MQAARLLWTETRIYRRRYAKSASALIATERALRRRRPLGGRETEFLALYRRTADTDPSLFTRVWLDPTAYFWVRMAYQLTATCLTGAPLPPLARDYCADLGHEAPDDALAHHLGAFKRFVLALRLGGRRTIRFSQPLEAALPLALPATALSLVGRGTVRIHGLRGRRLQVEHDGRAATVDLADAAGRADGIAVATCPTVATGGVRLALQPHALHLPGLGFARDVAAVPLDFQTTHAPVLTEALELVRRHHRGAHGHFARLMRLIVLKPFRVGGFTNLSHSDLPGAAICAVAGDPYEMADTLIHELHHNRFFFVEETGPFFRDAEEAVLDGRHYSPWRTDLRPLHGLFHALYVYLPVCRFWLAVHRSGETLGARRTYVLDRVLRIPLQLRLAAAVLRREADFTALGAALFGEMEREVGAIEKAARVLRLPPDAAAVKLMPEGGFVEEARTVRESVTAHIARHDRHHQCGEVAGAVRARSRRSKVR